MIAAELGAALIASRAPAPGPGAVLVPVPPAPLRRARRGFDPALEIGLALSAISGMPLEPALRRRDLRRQRGRPRAVRLSRPPLISAAGCAPAEAILIDDVVTTGATIDACARVLRLAGSRRVTVLALAAAPPPRERLRTSGGES